ncbi:MAG: LysR family transcriptional regulator [Pseudomonadota bacterium]
MDRFAELRAFRDVIDAGGFSAAGRQTGQSRASVNRLVIALEERLGLQLLNRTTRSVSPTSSGRALYERARLLLDDLDEMERAASSVRTEAAGKLRISVPLSFGDLNFSRLVTAFMARHPKVEIEMNADVRFVDPIAEGYDLLLRISEPDEETMMVDHRVLGLDYVLCAAPAYLAKRGSPVTAQDLAGHAAIYQSQSRKSPSWTLDGPAGRITVPVKPVFTANTLDDLLTAACAGLGIAIMPEYAIRSDFTAGRLQAVLPDHRPPPRFLQVIYPPARHLSAKVRLFTDFVTEWCASG